MRHHLLPKSLFPLLAVTVLAMPVISAQTSNTSTALPVGSVPKPPPPLQPPGPMDSLTMAERMELKAAHDKAIQQDPTLKQKMKAAYQAMEEARKAMQEAMVRVDPAVAPILQKIMPQRRAWGPPPSLGSGVTNGVTNPSLGNAVPPPGMGVTPSFLPITGSELERVRALREKVKADPSVVSARDALNQAKTPEELRAANQAFRTAIHDAMVKADPSIEPILEKFHPPVLQHPPVPLPSGAQQPSIPSVPPPPQQ